MQLVEITEYNQLCSLLKLKLFVVAIRVNQETLPKPLNVTQ